MTEKQLKILTRMRDAHRQSGHWPEQIDALDAAVRELSAMPTEPIKAEAVSGSWRDQPSQL